MEKTFSEELAGCVFDINPALVGESDEFRKIAFAEACKIMGKKTASGYFRRGACGSR